MNYREAIDKIVEIHHSAWGDFFQSLPSLKSLPREEIQSIILERIQLMILLVEQDHLSFADVFYFLQEFNVMRLLYVVCVWGGSNENVPITEMDLYNLDSAVHNLCSAGFGEEKGKKIFDTVKRLISEGVETHQLPKNITALLPGLTKIKTYELPRP